MKKKLVSLVLASALIFSYSATVFADAKDDRIAELEAQVEEMQKTIEELQEKLSKYESGSGMEEYLLEKGLLSGERTEMAADMVGAVSGFKYENTEIYEYDMESEAYQTLSSGGEITLEGFGVSMSPLAINDKYVLFGEASDELISSFKEYTPA